MTPKRASKVGLYAVGAISLAVLAAGVTLGSLSTKHAHEPDRAISVTPSEPSPAPSAPEPIAVASAAEGAPAPSQAPGLLVDRFVELVSSGAESVDEQDELDRVEAALLSSGEAGALALVDRLDHGRHGVAVRDRLLNLLRKFPGGAAEARLVREARSGKEPSSRALAIESLAERRSDRAVQALGEIARTDPTLPEHPLITTPRDPRDPSTELPDEVTFTPRMQAMAALASTRDPRAATILTDVLRDGPDESLRMEAARNLEALRGDPGASEALRRAAAGDASPYVRLAALRAARGSGDPLLAPVLEAIAAHDEDAGVRALAREVLASLRR
jgi:hypothetical protein